MVGREDSGRNENNYLCKKKTLIPFWKGAVVGAESQKRACDPHYLLGSSGIKMQAKNDSQYLKDVYNIKNPQYSEKVVREWVVMNYNGV